MGVLRALAERLPLAFALAAIVVALGCAVSAAIVAAVLHAGWPLLAVVAFYAAVGLHLLFARPRAPAAGSASIGGFQSRSNAC